MFSFSVVLWFIVGLLVGSSLQSLRHDIESQVITWFNYFNCGGRRGGGEWKVNYLDSRVSSRYTSETITANFCSSFVPLRWESEDGVRGDSGRALPLGNGDLPVICAETSKVMEFLAWKVRRKSLARVSMSWLAAVARIIEQMSRIWHYHPAAHLAALECQSLSANTRQ